MSQGLEIRPQFPDGSKRRVADARRSLESLRELLRKAEMCGIDCSTFEEVRQGIDGNLKTIEEVFRDDLK